MLESSGGYIFKSLKFIQDINVVAFESDYPYQGRLTECQLNELFEKGKLVNPFPTGKRLKVNRLNVSESLDHLVNIGPVAVVLMVPNVLSDYKTGVFSDDDKIAHLERSYHVMTLVGYGNDNESRKDFSLLKNSWGVDWGEQGFVRVERGVNAFEIEQITRFGLS